MLTRTACRHRLPGERGSSTVEYGLMVAALAALLVGVIMGAGQLARSAFLGTCASLSTQLTADGDCTQKTPGGSDPAGDDAPPSEDPAQNRSANEIGVTTDGL